MCVFCKVKHLTRHSSIVFLVLFQFVFCMSMFTFKTAYVLQLVWLTICKVGLHVVYKVIPICIFLYMAYLLI